MIAKTVRDFVTENDVIRLSTTCPAVIFAARRNLSVTGRTVILIVSIKTRKGFNQFGAPSGRKWAIVFFVECEMLMIIIDIHSGKPRDRVKIMCLVTLNRYGLIPTILMKIIIGNKVEIVIDAPFIVFILVLSVWVIMYVLIGIRRE